MFGLLDLNLGIWYRAFSRLHLWAVGPRGGGRLQGLPSKSINAMNEPPEPPAEQARSGNYDTVERADLELDVVFALEPLDEAIDVAFLAIKSAQQATRSIPDASSSTRFRDEWRISNVLVRQALRLVDERVQDLAKAIKRLPRVG